jgi:uncharacterized protein
MKKQTTSTLKSPLNRRHFLKASALTSLLLGCGWSVSAAQKTESPRDKTATTLKVAVLTGGHLFDVQNFHQLFRSFDGIDPYIQNMVDFAGSPPAVRDSYDVVLFYTMLRDPLQETELGPQLKRTKSAIERLRTSGQGIVVLHHAILSHPDWNVWTELTGLPNRKFTFDHDQHLKIQVTNSNHFITRGLKSWEMIDETYNMADAAEDNDILLTTDHPKSMKTICWAREFGKSRVCCLQSGHDNQTWTNPNFRQVLHRSVLWTGERAVTTKPS